MKKSESGQFELTRACCASENAIALSAVDATSDIYEPASVLWQYAHSGAAAGWDRREIAAHVERIVSVGSRQGYALLSSEGEVLLNVFSDLSVERIIGAGTWIDGAKGYGRMLALCGDGDSFYASGNGGQVYVRHSPAEWELLTDKLLYDPDAESRLNQTAPLTTDPGFLEWLMESMSKRPRNIAFHDISVLNEDAIYMCGVDGTTPILCFWDGAELHELKIHINEGALTGIFIENQDSVWVCGREGVLLHGSYARGFTPVNVRRQLNLFHMITPYRGKLALPSSVRPGGLFELDPATSDLRRFSPALPKLRGDYIFYAGAVNDVLWVVGQKDIFRFDGNDWERIEHPDL